MKFDLEDYKKAKKFAVDAGLDKSALKFDMQSKLGDLQKICDKFLAAQEEFAEAQGDFSLTCSAYVKFIESDRSIKTVSGDSVFEKAVKHFSAEIELLRKQSATLDGAIKMDTTDYTQFKKECERKGIDTKSLKQDFKKQVSNLVTKAEKLKPVAGKLTESSKECESSLKQYMVIVSKWTESMTDRGDKARGSAFETVLKRLLKQVVSAGESARI